MSKSQSWKWLLCLLLPLAVFYGVTIPEGTASPQTPLFLAITVWAVVAWAAEVLPASVIAAILTFLYALFVSSPKVAFAPYTTFLPWLCFTALIIADALIRTGISRRIALKCMLFMGASYARTIFGLLFSGIILTLLVPSGLARTVVYVAIAQGLCQALDVNPKSRMSSSLIMAGFFAAIAPGMFCATGTEMNLLAMQTVMSTTGTSIPWLEFIIQVGPFSLLYIILSGCLVFMIRGKERLPGEANLHDVLTARLREMGPVKADELKILAILLIGLTAFVTEQWHGMSGTFIFSLVGMACFLPGINLSNEQNLRSVNLSFIIFLAACQSIGFVAADLHVDKWLASELLPVLQGHSAAVSVTISYISGVLVNFLLTPMAAVGALGAPLTQLGLDLNIDPMALMYSFLYGLDQYIFPYEIGYLLYTFMSGAVTLRHIVPALGVRMVVMLVAIPVILVPYWKLIGLL